MQILTQPFKDFLARVIYQGYLLVFWRLNLEFQKEFLETKLGE